MEDGGFYADNFFLIHAGRRLVSRTAYTNAVLFSTL
jgi:hypothetical protein